MAIHQVNQSQSFVVEYANGYLCCPAGTHAGWQRMTRLAIGDRIVHYDGSRGVSRIRGISRVAGFGALPAGYTRVSNACAWFPGPHRSLNTFTPQKRVEQVRHRQNGTGFYEAHVEPLSVADDPRLARLPHVTYGGYLCSYSFDEALLADF